MAPGRTRAAVGRPGVAKWDFPRAERDRLGQHVGVLRRVVGVAGAAGSALVRLVHVQVMQIHVPVAEVRCDGRTAVGYERGLVAFEAQGVGLELVRAVKCPGIALAQEAELIVAVRLVTLAALLLGQRAVKTHLLGKLGLDARYPAPRLGLDARNVTFKTELSGGAGQQELPVREVRAVATAAVVPIEQFRVILRHGRDFGLEVLVTRHAEAGAPLSEPFARQGSVRLVTGGAACSQGAVRELGRRQVLFHFGMTADAQVLRRRPEEPARVRRVGVVTARAPRDRARLDLAGLVIPGAFGHFLVALEALGGDGFGLDETLACG